MAFLIHSFVYLVVIFLAFVFAILANAASSFIQSFFSKLSFGGDGILMWVWLFSSYIIAWLHQFIVLFVMYIFFLIR